MPTLILEHLAKSFGSLRALTDASLSVREGEIHALLGENGAGKTTLMNVVYGLLTPDAGRMELSGKPYSPRSPLEAVREGVGMVHQHFMLVPTLSVAENIVLGEHPFGLLRKRELHARIAERMDSQGFRFPLAERVGSLSVGELQKVEIFKALWKGARLLILDEPTAVLSPQEISELFALLSELRGKGHSVLFISHKLEEINRLCDRVTLLRRGSTVGCFEVSETDRKELSRLMLGREIQPVVRRPLGTRSEGEEVLTSPPKSEMQSNPLLQESFFIRCTGQGVGKLRGDWTCEVPAGQVTAIAGIEGNGQKDLAEAMLGLLESEAITVAHGNRPLPDGVRARIREGVGFISEDRQRTGLVLDFTVAENLALKDIASPPWSQCGWLAPRRSRERAAGLMAAYGIHPDRPEMEAARLSGGNQQKVVVAREISRGPRLLVATNPTRGLDVGACEAVHRALLAEVEKGLAVLLISTELEEILALADNLSVLHAGRLTPLPRERWNEEEIGLLMLGEKTEGTTA